MRWAALLRHQAPEEAVAILRQLKLDNDTINRVKTLVQWWKRPIGADQTQIRKTMSQMAPELYDDLLVLKTSVGELELQAEGCVEDLDWVKTQSREIRQRGDCVSLKELAVTGADPVRHEAGERTGRDVEAAPGTGSGASGVEYERNIKKSMILREIASTSGRDGAIFLCHRKLHPMTQKRSAGCALA